MTENDIEMNQIITDDNVVVEVMESSLGVNESTSTKRATSIGIGP